MKKILPIFIIIFLLSTSYAFSKGYKIRFDIKDKSHAKYLLCSWEWGKKYIIDSASSNTGKIIFKGKKVLNNGLYCIEKVKGEKRISLLEFIVPQNSKTFNSKFVIDTEKPYNLVKKGNYENKLFTKFQNLVKYNWKEFTTQQQFIAAIDSIEKESKTKLKGSLLNIILKHSLPNTKITLENINNPIIINTHFAPEYVNSYLKSIEINTNSSITYKLDSLISHTEDNKMKLFLASSVFNYFSNSKIMGQEEIAINIAEKWLLNNEEDLAKNQDLFLVKTFVEFNKNSLIGKQAPELELTDTLGNKISLNSLLGEYTILYFYTDDCASCKIETPKLIDFLDEYKDGVLNVYAVYTNDNAENWKKYINKEFNTYNPFVNWVNVYDPDFSSGFELLYNVIQTPQIYLLDKDKKIIGRGLNVKALRELIEIKNKERDDLLIFFNNYFSPLTNDTTAIYKAIDEFYSKSIKSKDLFNEIFRELLTFLGSNNNYSMQEGAVYLAKKYIISKPELWHKSFVDQAIKSVEAFEKNKLGTKAANLTLELPDKSSQTLYDNNLEYKVIYFYRPNCGICSVVTPKLAEIYREFSKKGNIEFYAINLGGDYTEWIKYIAATKANWVNLRGLDGNSTDIYKSYYINNIPSIYLLKNNIVIAKDISDIDLNNILKDVL